MSSIGKDVNWLRRATATTGDQTLTRLVGMLDGLRHRGEADQVLDNARVRLRALKPPRPLGFGRLLFLPLDGIIVASAQWRRDEARVPRGVLGVLAAAVLARLGPDAGAITQACEGRTTADPRAVAAIGSRLWPAAARSLPATAPADWEDTGLNAADYLALAGLCLPLWAQGPALWAALQAAGQGPPEDLVRAALAGLVAAGPRPFAAALASLLQRAAAPGQVLTIAARLEGVPRAVVQQMVDLVLDQPPPEFDQLEVPAAAAAALALVQRLDDLEGCGLLGGDRLRRLAASRRSADEGCRERFLTGAEQRILGPIVALANAVSVTDEQVAALEAEARGLRMLELAGRKLGQPGHYDRAVRAMAEAIGALLQRARQPDGLRPVDLARSIELLAGPEAAAALLRQAGG